MTTTAYQPFSLYGIDQQSCKDCGIALDASNTHPVSDDGTAYCITCAESRIQREHIALFFEDLARVAKIQRANDKKAAAHEKKLASLTITAKATFKATGAQLYAVESSEKTYHVTRIAGRVRSCIDAETGETCQARYYGADHCCHGDAVEMLEAAREQAVTAPAQAQEELAVAEQVAAEVMPELAADVVAHVEDELSSQQAAWARMTPMERRQAYSDLYPDDYGYAA